MRYLLILLLFATSLYSQAVRGVDLRDSAKDTIDARASALISDSLQNFKNLSYSTPKDYADDPDTVGVDRLYDDDEEIQLALNNAGYVYLPFGDYKINNVLRIKSNTYFEGAPGTTIFLEAAADTYMVQNWNIRTGGGNSSGLDSNIIISNIKFIGNAENQGSRSNYPGWGGFCVWMDSVKNVTIKDCYFENILNFAGWISHFQTVRLFNNGFNTDKDGINLIVGKDFVIDGSYGHTGDDMHALGIGSYSIFYQAIDGDVEDGIIKNINPFYVDSTKTTANDFYGAQSIVYMAGAGTGNAYKFKNILITDIRGDVNTYPIRILTGNIEAGKYTAGMQETNLEDIIIEKINTHTSYYPNVRFKATNAENIVIRDIVLSDTGTAVSAIELGDTTVTSTYKDIKIENIHGNYNHGNLIHFTDSTDFYGVSINNVSGRNSAGRHLIYIPGRNTFYDYFTLRNITADSVGMFHGSASTTIYDCPIVFQGYHAGHYSNSIILKGAGTITASFQDGFYESCVYSVQCNTATTDYRLLGGNITYKDSESWVYTVGNTLSINNRDLVIPTQNLVPQNGDVVYSKSTSTNSPINSVVQYNTTDSLWHLYQNKYLVYTFGGDPPSINAASAWDTTYTINPLSTTNDMILVDAPYDLSNYFLWTARISANNTVRIKLYNTHTSAVDQAAFADSWRIMVYKKP